MNLVIGTLYCAKNNHQFGLSRIIKSLEPYHKKLGTDTWYYAKRCFLAVIEKMAKQMLVLPDDSMNELLHFFDIAEEYGKDIKTVSYIPSPSPRHSLLLSALGSWTA